MILPASHDDCAAFMKQKMAELGCDINVSATPPIFASPYGAENLTCPHGTTYWYEPTSEQVAEWVRGGVA